MNNLATVPSAGEGGDRNKKTGGSDKFIPRTPHLLKRPFFTTFIRCNDQMFPFQLRSKAMGILHFSLLPVAAGQVTLFGEGSGAVGSQIFFTFFSPFW